MKKILLCMLLVTSVFGETKKTENVITITETEFRGFLGRIVNQAVAHCKGTVNNMSVQYESLIRKQEARFTSLSKCYEDFRHNVVNLDQNPKEADTTLKKCMLNTQETK